MWHLGFSQMGRVYCRNPYHPAGTAPRKGAAPPLRPTTHPQERGSWEQSWWPDEGREGQAAWSLGFCAGSARLPPVGDGVRPLRGLGRGRRPCGSAQILGGLSWKEDRRGALGRGAVPARPGLNGHRARGLDRMTSTTSSCPGTSIHSFTQQSLRALCALRLKLETGATVMSKLIRANFCGSFFGAGHILSCTLLSTREL